MLDNKNILTQHFIRKPGLKWNMIDVESDEPICSFNSTSLEDGKLSTSENQLNNQKVVELVMEHHGFFAFIAQKLFRRPAISYIKLDGLGSFIWLQLQKQDNIMDIAPAVKEHFGETAEPLLPRLAQFFQILVNNHFIEEKSNN